MRIDINGEPHEVAPNSTITMLLTVLGVHDGPVAVERNRAIVPRAEHATTTLRDGDELEVVHFVGGG